MPRWTYQELLQASDVVAIAEPIANTNNKDLLGFDSQFDQGVTTTFRVLCFLKSVAPDVDTIRVKHFKYIGGMPANAGVMVAFSVTPYLPTNESLEDRGSVLLYGKEKHERWLIFLKKSPDGSFAPTSGQVDPDFSFFSLRGT